MDNLRTWLRRLGTEGATRNAELAVRSRLDEDRLVASLRTRFAEAIEQAA